MLMLEAVRLQIFWMKYHETSASKNIYCCRPKIEAITNEDEVLTPEETSKSE